MGDLPYQLVQDFFHQQYHTQSDFSVSSGSCIFLALLLDFLRLLEQFLHTLTNQKSQPKKPQGQNGDSQQRNHIMVAVFQLMF